MNRLTCPNCQSTRVRQRTTYERRYEWAVVLEDFTVLEAYDPVPSEPTTHFICGWCAESWPTLEALQEACESALRWANW